MLGATSYTLAKHGLAFTGEQWAILAVGSAASFLTAYAVVAWLMRYIQTHDFRPFGWYRIVLGLVVLAYFLSVGYYAATPAP
jgi:undecaprenyl-diphosphatase